ncbi:hypothetical protein PanWU01x14_270630 [Parasponia andersonii]|uniref:Uncharacterized protein n=1 Tax=Parasponia andersonii TaxID=3476 RepID=A0A2P5B4Y4_PARAD|nr:hypothetical protein PanWU01x14_270630 [Parasponia andersonii]
MHLRRQKVSWEPLKMESSSGVVRKKVVLVDIFIGLIEGRHTPGHGFQRRVPLLSATSREADDDAPQTKHDSVDVQGEKDEAVVWLLVMGDWIW